MLTSEYLESEITGEPEHCVSGSHTSEFDRVSPSSKPNIFLKKIIKPGLELYFPPLVFKYIQISFILLKEKLFTVGREQYSTCGLSMCSL